MPKLSVSVPADLYEQATRLAAPARGASAVFQLALRALVESRAPSRVLVPAAAVADAQAALRRLTAAGQEEWDAGFCTAVERLKIMPNPLGFLRAAEGCSFEVDVMIEDELRRQFRDRGAGVTRDEAPWLAELMSDIGWREDTPEDPDAPVPSATLEFQYGYDAALNHLWSEYQLQMPSGNVHQSEPAQGEGN